MRIIWTKSARLARLAIIRHIGKYDLEAASSFNTEITQKVLKLVRFPNLGRVGRVKGTRELLLTPNYFVIYKVGGDEVSIVNILHSAQRYP